MAEETAVGKPLEVYVSKTESELLAGEPNVLGLSSDQNTIVFNNKVIGSGSEIRYKKIILSAGQRWIRFAVANHGAASHPTVIFGIDRGFGNSKDEHYIFASTLSHQKKGYITQLSGVYGSTETHFIKKVRTAQYKSDVEPFYLDFYVDSTTTEAYYVWVLGHWDLLDLSVADEQQDATDNITRYVEFETSNGFNLDNDSLQIFRDKILSGLAEMTADIRDTTLISTSDATGETGKWYKRKATTFWNYIKAKLGTVGSLGIGTTTPTVMLEVNGEIKATGIDASLYHFINETKNYHHYVYLLGKVQMEGGNYTAVGKLFFRQQGADRFGSYDVAIHVSNNLVSSTWYETSFYLLNTGNDSTSTFDLVQCTYEGEQYWALRLSGIQARKVYFSGYYKNVLWTPISYYNTNTEEILNEEIYNSIIEKNDLLKRPNINGNEVVLKNDVVLADYFNKTARVLTTSTTRKGKFAKFATITLDGAWDSCAGTYILYSSEGKFWGIGYFLVRTDATAGNIYSGSFQWGNVNDAALTTSIRVVKPTANTIDLYFCIDQSYCTPVISFLSNSHEKITTYNNVAYVDSIDQWTQSTFGGFVARAYQDASGNNIVDTYAPRKSTLGIKGDLYNVTSYEMALSKYGLGGVGFNNSGYTLTISELDADTWVQKFSNKDANLTTGVQQALEKGTQALLYTSTIGSKVKIHVSTTTYNYFKEAALHLFTGGKAIQCVFSSGSYTRQSTVSTNGSWYVVNVGQDTSIREFEIVLNSTDVADTQIKISGIRIFQTNASPKFFGKSLESYSSDYATASGKATSDKNNKDLTTYVSDIKKTANGIQITKGDGTTSAVDISSNILRFHGVLDVEPTYTSSGVSSWNYITFVKPLNKFVAVNNSTLPPTYHQVFNNGEISQDTYNNNPNVLFIDNITGETYTWHGDTNETFSKISDDNSYAQKNATPEFSGIVATAEISEGAATTWESIVYVTSECCFAAKVRNAPTDTNIYSYYAFFDNGVIKDSYYQDEDGILMNKVFRCNNTLYRFDYDNLVEVNRQLMLDVLVEQNQLYIRTNRPLVTGEKFYFMRSGKYTTGYQNWNDNSRNTLHRKGWRRYQPYPNNDSNFTSYIVEVDDSNNSDNSIAFEYVDTCNVTAINTTAVGAKYWTYRITGITVENLIKQFGNSYDYELVIRNGSKKRKLRVAYVVDGVTQIPQKQRIQLQYGIAVYTRTYNSNKKEGFIATQEERVSNIAPFKFEIRNWKWGDNEHEYMIVPFDFQNGDMTWLEGYASIKA